MKKRAYVLIYSIFVLALLFMVVLTVTDASVDRANISTYIRDYNTLKYKSESDSYLAIDTLFNSEDFKEKLLRLARERSGGNKETFGMELNSLIDGRKFSVDIEKDVDGYTNLVTKHSEQGITLNANGKIKLYNDLFYKEPLLFDIDSVKEDYAAVFNSELIDTYLEKMMFMDRNKPIMIRSNLTNIEYAELEDLVYGIESEELETKDDDEPNLIEEEAGIDHQDETTLEEPMDEEIVEITDEESEEFEDEDPEETNDVNESTQTDVISEVDADPEDEFEDIEEDDLEVPDEEEVSDEENQVDAELEFNRINKEIIKEFVIGPLVHYKSDQKIKLAGIITIDENTIIESDIDLSGILILKGTPKHIRGSVKVEGAIFTDVELMNYIIHLNNKHRFEKYASIYTGFFKPKVVELYYFY